MDSFTPLSNDPSSLAKMFTLLSSKEWSSSFRCKRTAEIRPSCVVPFVYGEVVLSPPPPTYTSVYSPLQLIRTEEPFWTRGEMSSRIWNTSCSLTIQHLELPWPGWLRTFISIQNKLFCCHEQPQPCINVCPYYRGEIEDVGGLINQSKEEVLTLWCVLLQR